MADTKLRSPDGTRERWFNEKEVAHLTSKADPADRWTVVVDAGEPPRDPHDVIEDVPTPPIEVEEGPVTEPTEESPVPRPTPKPLPKPKTPANKGRSR